VIPGLGEIAGQFAAIALAALLTGFILLAQAVAGCFDDRDS
jgi:hypothetical protein